MRALLCVRGCVRVAHCAQSVPPAGTFGLLAGPCTGGTALPAGPATAAAAALPIAGPARRQQQHSVTTACGDAELLLRMPACLRRLHMLPWPWRSAARHQRPLGAGQAATVTQPSLLLVGPLGLLARSEAPRRHEPMQGTHMPLPAPSRRTWDSQTAPLWLPTAAPRRLSCTCRWSPASVAPDC